ncbi:hypothetical protein FHU41_002365 [Psychromicrobium silvestre]|uniref:Uncharacterized protein n=1 Tax=Psychromicrobium silvestre TaxID=1645614 RepID=A0A7Y9LV00_9MICC|nr:hypothetical protein [Psychromicrobium silvestre]
MNLEEFNKIVRILALRTNPPSKLAPTLKSSKGAGYRRRSYPFLAKADSRR